MKLPSKHSGSGVACSGPHRSAKCELDLIVALAKAIKNIFCKATYFLLQAAERRARARLCVLTNLSFFGIMLVVKAFV